MSKHVVRDGNQRKQHTASAMLCSKVCCEDRDSRYSSTCKRNYSLTEYNQANFILKLWLIIEHWFRNSNAIKRQRTECSPKHISIKDLFNLWNSHLAHQLRGNTKWYAAQSGMGWILEPVFQINIRLHCAIFMRAIHNGLHDVYATSEI